MAYNLIYNDILYNIMLQADVNTLRELCSTNKKTNIYCNDLLFWKTKLQNEGLLEYDTKIELTPIDKYQYILMAKKSMEDTLIINKIEKFRQSNNTVGTIVLFANGEYTSFTQLPLPLSLIKNLESQLEDINNDIGILYFYITLRRDGRYDLRCTIRDNITEEEYRAGIITDDETIKKILYKFIFDYYTGHSSMEITDENQRPFLFGPLFNFLDYKSYSESVLRMLYIRRGLWESLNTDII